MNRFLSTLWLVALHFASGCTKHTDKESVQLPAKITVSGVVQLGRVAGTRVDIYEAMTNRFLAVATTDATGSFSVELPTTAPPYLYVTARGGTFTSEADGVVRKNTTTLSAISSIGSPIAITPFSTLVTARVTAQQRPENSASELGAFIGAAQSDVAKMMGTSVQVLTSIPNPPQAPGLPDDSSAVASLKIAAFEVVAKSARLSSGRFVELLADDFKDRVIDGKGSGAPINAQIPTGLWESGMPWAEKQLAQKPTPQAQFGAFNLIAGKNAFLANPAAEVAAAPAPFPGCLAPDPACGSGTDPLCLGFGSAACPSPPGICGGGLCVSGAVSCLAFDMLKGCLEFECLATCAAGCVTEYADPPAFVPCDDGAGTCSGDRQIGTWKCKCNNNGVCDGAETPATCLADCPVPPPPMCLVSLTVGGKNVKQRMVCPTTTPTVMPTVTPTVIH